MLMSRQRGDVSCADIHTHLYIYMYVCVCVLVLVLVRVDIQNRAPPLGLSVYR